MKCVCCGSHRTIKLGESFCDEENISGNSLFDYGELITVFYECKNCKSEFDTNRKKLPNLDDAIKALREQGKIPKGKIK